MNGRIIGFLVILVLGSSFSTAAAFQDWKLSILSDVALMDSTITDNVPRVVNFYVLETYDLNGATGVGWFSVEPDPGFTGVWLADTTPFVHLGTTPTSFTVGYGACIPSPVLVVTMTYQLFGTSACTALRIVPPDGFPFVVAPDVGCHFSEGPIRDFGALHINCDPVATEPTTWGKVKALYR